MLPHGSVTDDKRESPRHTRHEISNVLPENHMRLAGSSETEIVEMLERIDTNGDRNIDFREFSAMMRNIDHAVTEAALHAGFDKIDTDRNGKVSFDEFSAWVSR
jgi:Ca2+-binding EF-hand superfamily protein